MTEEDWPILERWNSDPEILYYCEIDDVSHRTPDEVRQIYRGVSQAAFCFIIELDERPIGECWLQEMNIERVLRQYPHMDCRRIDLMIGEKELWGQGIGTQTIRLLTEFAFLTEGVDIIYEPGIADYNHRSRRAFQRVGYEIMGKRRGKPGGKAEYLYDLALSREKFLQDRS